MHESAPVLCLCSFAITHVHWMKDMIVPGKARDEALRRQLRQDKTSCAGICTCTAHCVIAPRVCLGRVPLGVQGMLCQ